MSAIADICIIAEGSYPYYYGGVAQWVHELITAQSERTFHVLTLVPPNPDLTLCYQFPKNVIGHTLYYLQDLPPGLSKPRSPEMWEIINSTLKGLVSSNSFEEIKPILDLFRIDRNVLGKRILCESTEAWNSYLKLYHDLLPTGPFKAYFATIYTLSRSLYSLLLPELPKARLYHALCTGYAGFMLYRAKQEYDAPCIVTEQGMYTNERRIEISMADWITEVGSLDLALEDKKKTLKDFWLNAFFSLAHVCYMSSDEILSTYDGNHEIQFEGGADPKKVKTIVHGIEQKDYAAVKKDRRQHPPTIAFIGRVVPIKDVKTFIHACKIVKTRIPDVRIYALGSCKEDEEYFEECQKLVDLLQMKEHIHFLGQVNLKEYFPEIDVIVLTSISEAQPLVILEGGAVGIPVVATNVGGCKQLLYGSDEESPPLGQGGIVTPLVDPEAIAQAIVYLLTDHEFYQKCSETIAKRIKTYYVFQNEQEEYRKIYDKYLAQ